jgi:hypothetical protein
MPALQDLLVCRVLEVNMDPVVKKAREVITDLRDQKDPQARMVNPDHRDL